MRTIPKTLKSLAATVLVGVFALAAVACGQDSGSTEQSQSQVPPEPEKSQEVAAVSDLPAAPDFTLPAANRDNAEISLSSFQGDKEVVLVFYRAYW